MLTKEQVERMRTMIARGDSPTHIARAVDCSRQRVYTEKRKMKREGTRGAPTRTPPKISVLTEFHQRAARIEVEEAIKGVREAAANLLHDPDCEPGERDRVRALVRECDEAVKLVGLLASSEVEELLDEVRDRFTRAAGRLDARRALERHLASTRGHLGAVVTQYNKATQKCSEEEARLEWLSGINARAEKELHERVRRKDALFQEEGEILKRIGVARDIEKLLSRRTALEGEVGELRDIQARRAELARLRSELMKTTPYRDALSSAIIDREDVLTLARLTEGAILLSAFERVPTDQLKTIRVALDSEERRRGGLAFVAPPVQEGRQEALDRRPLVANAGSQQILKP